MKREDLEKMGLEKGQIEEIMKLHGKSLQTEQDRGKQSLDAAVKTQLKARMDVVIKENKKALEDLREQHAAETAKLAREAETKDFFFNLGKKFVTPETQAVFETKLNKVLEEGKNEGKSRADIFKTLTLDAEGKERTDLFVIVDPHSTQAPNVTGGTSPPAGGKSSGDFFLSGFYGEDGVS